MIRIDDTLNNLDSRIAALLFGIEVVVSPYNGRWVGVYEPDKAPGTPWLLEDGREIYSLREYSGSKYYVWDIVEAMKERGYCMDLGCDDLGYWAQFWYHAADRGPIERAETAPEVVCKAALVALDDASGTKEGGDDGRNEAEAQG